MNARRQRAYYKLRSAVQAVEAGDLAQARQRLHEALDFDHEYSDARQWLGHVAEREDDLETALRQCRIGLVFDPHNAALRTAAEGLQRGLRFGDRGEQQELLNARRRATSNLIFALLVPPAGFLMGLWATMTGRTPAWRDLGVRTLGMSLVGAFGYFLMIVFYIATMGPG